MRSTSYIYAGTPLIERNAAQDEADGFEVALHVQNGCANYTAANLNGSYATQLQDSRPRIRSVSPPATNRTHCLVWSDYDTQPQVEVLIGIRLNTSYYYFPSTWVANRPGMFTGSGWPMRFARSTGEMIDSIRRRRR